MLPLPAYPMPVALLLHVTVVVQDGGAHTLEVPADLGTEMHTDEGRWHFRAPFSLRAPRPQAVLAATKPHTFSLIIPNSADTLLHKRPLSMGLSWHWSLLSPV